MNPAAIFVKPVFLVYLFLFPCFSWGQLSAENSAQLREELTQKVNALRTSLNLKPLQNDEVLKNAAQLHSNYMFEHLTLSHDELSKGLETPDDRVRKMGGKDFESVGENVLSSLPQKEKFSVKSISLLAEEMFQSWKKSPGHYANMTNPSYEYGDFGFTFEPNSKVVYAVQVFGKKGTVIQNQISQNAFGLLQASKDCEREYHDYANVVMNMGNSFERVENDIVLSYHDKEWLKKIIKDPTDGIAVDLIKRDQLACGKENQFDLSSIYDGILLRPIYRDELFAGNYAKGDYRIVTSLGEIPDHLAEEEYNISVIIINDGKACKYLFPAFVPSRDYPLIPIDPVWEQDTSNWMKSGIRATEELIYNFKTSKTVPVTVPRITGKGEVYAVQVQAFSSVEGDSLKNQQLAASRASYIENDILKRTRAQVDQVTKNAGENWKMNDFQLLYFDQQELLRLDHDTLRKLENRHSKYQIPWDSLLYEQRVAKAIINYAGKFPITRDSVLFYEGNLRTAVALKNNSLFNKAAKALYYSRSGKEMVAETEIFEYALMNKEVVAAYAALLSKTYRSHEQLATRFIVEWNRKATVLSSAAKTNLSYLYALLGTQFLDEWDVARERLAKVVKPDRLKQLVEGVGPPELILDLQLTFIQYYGQVNDGVRIQKCFDYISTYFKSHTLNEKDVVNLAYFFNSWSVYPMTVDLLLPRFKNRQLNEDGVFALAQTKTLMEGVDPSPELLEVIKEANRLNKTRWCDWISDYYQTLRYNGVKEIYCESCE